MRRSLLALAIFLSLSALMPLPLSRSATLAAAAPTSTTAVKVKAHKIKLPQLVSADEAQDAEDQKKKDKRINRRDQQENVLAIIFASVAIAFAVLLMYFLLQHCCSPADGVSAAATQPNDLPPRWSMRHDADAEMLGAVYWG